MKEKKSSSKSNQSSSQDKRGRKVVKVDPSQRVRTSDGKHKVVMALLVPEVIDVATETSLWTIARHPDIIARIKVEGNLGYRARNEAFRQISSVFGDQYTHVLFIHAQTLFGVKDYEALKKANKDIVSALYVNSTAPYLPVYKPLSENRVDFMPLINELQKDKPGLIKVAETGLDFALISREVVEKTRKEFVKGVPEWFWVERDEKGSMTNETSTFCQGAREKGFDVFVHTGIRIGKMTRQAVYVQNFLSYLQEENNKHAQGLLAKIEAADPGSSPKKAKT